MAERKHITLLYQHNSNWIGGTYYIVNIVKSLNCLEDEIKPFITILFNDVNSISLIEEIGYPYIEFHSFMLRYSTIARIVNKISRFVTSRNIIKVKISSLDIKNLYPVSEGVDVSDIKQFYYWIPDFQEFYLPQFFTKEEIKQRSAHQKYLVKKKYPIVFSSKNAVHDFNKFYPDNKNRKEVLNFVSIISDKYKHLKSTDLLEKYDIKGDYFISPNQFWQHKNQMIVLKAAKLLKMQGLNFKIVFTGKEYDPRHPDFFSTITNFVSENDLTEEIYFLGFIDRDEQLCLMKNSISVIQPSLFEGWSTVVEDVKAINHSIILSDIPLHREQIDQNCSFFNPKDEHDLASTMINSLNLPQKSVDFNYEGGKIKFAKEFISIFND